MSDKDAIVKQRIITHMNDDHQDSLVRYLQCFSGLSSFSARNARLIDITFFDLTIEASSKALHRIPIKPPMTTWSEARPRVVAMDHEAVAKLNVSPITIKTYERPRNIQLVVFVASAVTFAIFPYRANLRPGSLFYDDFLYHFPNFASFCWKIQPIVMLFMVILHGFEATLMARTKLAKHSVPMGSILWWAWMGSVFIEGVGAFSRFNKLVKDEESRRAQAKH